MRILPILAFALALLVPQAAAQAVAQAALPTVGSRDLIERGRDYDGKAIWYEGEAIGDPMVRGDHAWVNFLDSNAALGAWLPKELQARIGSYGSYRGKGDIVRVRGIFHRACPDHGGDMDIHVEALEFVSRGGTVAHTPATATLILAPLSILAALGLYLFWRRREEAIRESLSRLEGGGRDGSLHRSP